MAIGNRYMARWSGLWVAVVVAFTNHNNIKRSCGESASPASRYLGGSNGKRGESNGWREQITDQYSQSRIVNRQAPENNHGQHGA